MSIHYIPDPHMGREFRVGVPAHRRGEREASQNEDLRHHLATNCDMNVCVGDLFDKPFVSMGVLADVITAYRRAALGRPGTTFVVVAGNHCRSRQPEVRSAFDVFQRALAELTNVHVLIEPERVGDVAFFPWQWGRPALDQLADLDLTGVKTAVGHWDLQSFGGDDSHLCPAAALNAAGVETIVSGHYHLPGVYMIEGIDVICTGSMQPFSFAEDPEAKLYVTLTVAEFEAAGPADFSNKCVRVVLAPGEDAPAAPDCLQFSVLRGRAETDEAALVEPDAFDWNALLGAELAKVTPGVRAFIEERL